MKHQSVHRSPTIQDMSFPIWLNSKGVLLKPPWIRYNIILFTQNSKLSLTIFVKLFFHSHRDGLYVRLQKDLPNTGEVSKLTCQSPVMQLTYIKFSRFCMFNSASWSIRRYLQWLEGRVKVGKESRQSSQAALYWSGVENKYLSISCKEIRNCFN